MTKRAADLFCGAGGTSRGYLNACDKLGVKPSLLAINHWPRAIETHSLNHPGVSHLCQTLDKINPREAIPGKRLNLLCASPECTHHSLAAGGRPKNEQSRATAWHVLHWAEALYVENILIENVREFLNWGPLTSKGKPMKRYRGQTFRKFIEQLQSLGYNVDYRVLCAADYGDPTTRQRLFIQARRNRRITWPEPTHAKEGTNGLPPWRSAREIIDWELKGESIFRRKKSLSPNTLRRIAAGLKKFGGLNAEPFLVMLYGTNKVRSVGRPAPTVTAGGQKIGLCQPFVTHEGGDRCHAVDNPLPTVTTAKRGELALIEPFITKFHGSHESRNDGDLRNHSVETPLPTLDTSNRFGLVEPKIKPFVLGQQSCAAPRDVQEPLPTVATDGAIALVEPFIVKYYGSGISVSVDEPLDTVTSRDRFMLVEPRSRKPVAELDILFRMLQPHELAAAQGFPASFQFTGTREEKVKQIGNAVPVHLATALCYEILK